MWAAIGRSLKKGEMPSIDSMIQGNKVEVREGKFTAGFFNQEQGSNAAKPPVCFPPNNLEASLCS